MGPKPRGRKLDPEEQKAQFEAWKQSPEYLKMVEIEGKLKKMENITSTTPDLPGPWQDILNKIWELLKLLKVKTGKLKELPQPTVRSFFFAKENQQNEIHIMDGIDVGVEREHANIADKLRHKVTEIMDFCKDKLDMLKPEDYLNEKKNLIKSMQEFIKFYQPHLKTGHKIIYEGKMALVMRPLQELININYSYRTFMMGFIREVEREVRDFKLKALKRKYVVALQEVMRILYEESGEKKLPCTPDINRTFNKLEYKNWKDNPVEKMYLEPLHVNFKKVQKTLFQMWLDKINFWKIPLFDNVDLVKDIVTLIKSDMIAERLLGNPIRRDQLNFVFQVVQIIEKADQKIKENLLRKDENIVKNTIPKLIIFKAIQRMRKWKDQKATDEVKQKELDLRISELKQKKFEEEKNSPLKLANRSFVQNVSILIQTQTQDMNKTQSPKKSSPSPKPNQKKDQKLPEVEEEKSPEQKEWEKSEEKYGRYWLFDGLMDDSKKQVFEQCIEQIRHVNPAVQQDIEDKIINRGIQPKAKRKDDLLQQANDYLAQKSEKDNANRYVICTRPPELWNYPKILEKHDFRFIAEPKNCYLDQRIEAFDIRLEELAKHIDTFQEFYWRHLVDRVIDVILCKYQEEPKDLPPTEFQFDAPKRKYDEEQ